MPSEGDNRSTTGNQLTQLEQCEPQSIAELRDILLTGDEPVLVSGGGTKLSFSNSGGPFATHVSTNRLNNVLHYEPADLTIAVEAGMTPAELNRILGEHNQMLPVDCPEPETSTLGGMFASGLGGPRRLKYGSLRDWTLGVEVMTADGVLTKSGGMVVKNVTGYDLPRLHYGAHGSFGIVTRLNLKVLPRNEATRGIMLWFNSPDAAHAAAVQVLTSQLDPESVLIASDDDCWKVSITCASPASTIDWLVDAITDTAGSSEDLLETRVETGPEHALTDFINAVRFDGKAIARFSVPASQQLPVLEHFAQLSGSLICADPGSGLIYVAGLPSLEWREALRRSSDTCVFLALPDELKTGVDVFGRQNGTTLELLRRLRNEFDPERRINRGRFILGV
jgi:glycolate oxidase FAD binding subunit